MGTHRIIEVKVSNTIGGSGPVLLKKWVKIRYVPTQEELDQVAAENGEKKGALELAEQIIGGQMKLE